MKRKFSLGEMFATISIVELCKHTDLDLGPFIDRHASGDWGDVDEEHSNEMDIALENNARVWSVYHPHGRRILIVTDADRSRTVAMLPHEYS
ncbi:type I restriction endonuclease subunit M [Vibrio parahaemolyticus]|uniref:type I restriction endonuclease subunit M n=1 Tax=Vibrio parahaemolyticus TaxID=670 RepID=UPI002807E723|nr:type I restriction endonuclease subunit M [Vibrio parahaemolyticus]EJE4644404.1 type I restriction endonuclease subunit M [Vibrio parahaemolyticus]ELA9292948.1 type I restriction endonuclease subunit M [Vibrio parahaemolyticus]MDS1925689.1 type I restriction endonuclease subunit M [Vibrio parahaemolyticus]HCG8016797.1 type I restriction endonuclease subunit M [Vibrio parahaemolyticus]